MLRLVVSMATIVAVGSGAARGQECAGDCEGGGSVSITELMGCVNIALGSDAVGACDACDVDGSTRVSIGELVAAVKAALDGCQAPPAASAVAHFELSEPGTMNWGDVPFPSDLYRDETGAIRIGALPTTKAETPLHAAMRDLVQQRDGFCATCNVYFSVDGEIDGATLPAEATAAAGDGVLLVDVDAQSPERGRLFPLRIEWNAERHLLALRPVRGIALHRKRRYAAILTTAVRAADGSPLGASEGFRLVRNRRSAAAAEIEHARRVLAPAFDELERLGIGRSRIVALASFTTEDVTADVLGARAAVQGGPPLAVSIERWRRDDEIDELLGIPSVDRPGIDVPPADGVAGTRSIAHSSIADVITGTFVAARIVSGAGKDIGTALRDQDGAIVAGPREAVPFVLTLPAVPAGVPVPVVIAHHGFNASRVTGFASADTAARAGVAVLAIDAFQHGERAVSAHDDVHALRGDLAGPDGFAETVMLDLSARVFGLLGAAPGLELFPGYSLGAFLQFSADVASAVRAVREGPLAQALRDAGAPAFAGFDPQRIGFIGNSLGAVVGASVLVAEPDVRFAVQNVPPGSIVETLAESPEFRPLVQALFLPTFGVEGTFDEVERRLLFNPIIDLSRWILEPIDPLALAPYLLLDPARPEPPAEILFQVAMLDEVAAPLATQSMLAATGSTRVTRYDPAAHGMLEVLNQSSRYVPPAVPPFLLRPVEVPVVNPIIEEHQEIEAFLAENVGTGAASTQPD
ncbi:MAG: hypothetical protein ACRERC_23415 [Candidatus Binatia bacterium]